MDLKTDQSQNKNYQKYKDDIDDKTTQILIDNKETPPKYKNLIKKKEIKKPLIGIVDVLISILILSPCVVGVWRGTWQLMDINSRYFPPWKSFIAGLIIHFAFIMTQDIILEFVKKKTSNIPRKIFNQILTRLYIYVSMIACNMHWRGAWIIIDHYLGVQKNSKGYIIRKNSEVMLVISGGCFLLTVGLRSLCNCMAPPFVFCIDTKHNTFTIPTRFGAKVVYLLMNVVNDPPNVSTFENTIEEPTSAERLVLAASTQSETVEKLPPKPFGVTFHGLQPSEFTSTTEKVTTLNYPQMSYNRPRYYPRNIQEVINYNRYYKQPDLDLNLRNYKQSPSYNLNKNFTHHDPFYLYKPQEPGDINLLATENLRFAPPIWSNLNKKIPKLPPQYHENTKRQENTNRHEIYNPPKPLTVTLNIYPNENEIRNHGLKHLFSHRLGNLQSRVKLQENTPKKMVIHLNLYPDGEESKIFKNVLTPPPPLS